LGYNTNYVKTFAADGLHGHNIYSPKMNVALTQDLRMQYTDMLSHQSQYLLKHENVLKTNMLNVNDGLLHGYGDINSYYYHLEQQRGIIDDIHLRVANGGRYGYHYNPYYGAGHYPYAGFQQSTEYEHSIKASQEYGWPSPVAVAEPAAVTEDVAPGLSAGEIAGIVIGSVIGFLLILLLCAVLMARNFK
jgi:hypothetical protein